MGRYRHPVAEAPTSEKLLDAAARLFAERGIDNVSIAEIVRAAGQKNASAVHYHFGGKNEILHALLARHVPDIAERRRELLDKARAGDPTASLPAGMFLLITAPAPV